MNEPIKIELVNRFTGESCVLPTLGRSSLWAWQTGVSEAIIQFDKTLLDNCCVCENPIPGTDEIVISTADGEIKWCGPLWLYDTTGNKITLRAYDRSIWSHADGDRTLRKLWDLLLAEQDAAFAYRDLMQQASTVDNTGITHYNVVAAGLTWTIDNELGDSIGDHTSKIAKLVDQVTICAETWIGDHDYGVPSVTLTQEDWAEDANGLGIRRSLFEQGSRFCVVGPDGPAAYPVDAATAVDAECGGLVERVTIDSDGDVVIAATQEAAMAIARKRAQRCNGTYLVPGEGNTRCTFPLDCDEVRPGMHVYVSVSSDCLTLEEEWMRVEGIVFAEAGGIQQVYAPVLGPARIDAQ